MNHPDESTANSLDRRTPPDGTARRILILDTMLGSTGRHSRSQGEQLVELLDGDGFDVRAASRRPSRPLRLVDTLLAVARWGRWADVVSIAVFSGPAFWLADLSSRMARRLGTPIVLTLHGGNLPLYAERHPRRVRSLLRRANIVVSPSTFNASKLGALTEQPIRVIDNVVELETRPRDRDPADPIVRPRIFWMRSLHSIYGPDVAIETLARVVRSHPDATMTMAGPDKGGLGPDLQRHIERLGLTDKIELVGFLDTPGKATMFDEHDIYLNTSRIDNTPVSLLEAAANGLTVVSTRAGGIPDLFHHDDTALLAPVDDPDVLASSVISLLDQPERAIRLATRARHMTARMSWETLGPVWTHAFNDALADLDTRAR